MGGIKFFNLENRLQFSSLLPLQGYLGSFFRDCITLKKTPVPFPPMKEQRDLILQPLP